MGAAGQVIELMGNFIPQFLGTNWLTASVSQSRPEADLSDNTAVVPFNTVEQADLAAFLTLRGSSPARITRGSVEVYQAKVRNNGFSASADVQTVFTVPSNGVLELVEGGAGNTTCGPLDEALRTVTCTTFPGYRMPASTEVLTLASFTVLFPSDLNVTVFVNGTEMVANVTATVELSSLSVLDAQLDNNIASLTIPAGFASADIGVATVDGKDKSSFSWVTSSGAVRTGSRLAGRLSAFNYGPFPGAGVVIEIRAPGSAIFGNTPPSVVVDSGGSASSVIGFVTCAENGFTPERTTLECTVASFPNGAILAIDVSGTVTAVTNETVTFEAEVVASALPDPDTSNDMASFTAKIEPSVSEDGETAFVAPQTRRRLVWAGSCGSSSFLALPWSSSLSWAPLAFSSGRSPPPTLKSKPPRPRLIWRWMGLIPTRFWMEGMMVGGGLRLRSCEQAWSSTRAKRVGERNVKRAEQ